MQILKESLNSVRDIIMFRAKKYFSKIFTLKSMEVASLGYKISFLNRMPRIWYEIATVIIISFIIIFSSFQNVEALSILGTLGIFLISALKIMPSLTKILVSIQQIRHSETAVKSLKEDFKIIYRNKKDEEILRNEGEKLEFKNKISFSNVGYKYVSKDQETLSNLNFQIKKMIL